MDEPEGLDRVASRLERLRRWWSEGGAGNDLASDDILALSMDRDLAASVFEGASAEEIFHAGVGAGEIQYVRVSRNLGAEGDPT